MPTPLYECAHIPIKTAWWAIKNPVPAGVGGVFCLVIFTFYGIWPFVAIGGTVTAAMITFMVLVSRQAQAEEVRLNAKMRTSRQAVSCIRHVDRLAVSIYRIPLPSGETKVIPICAACIPEFETWLTGKQLTRG